MNYKMSYWITHPGGGQEDSPLLDRLGLELAQRLRIRPEFMPLAKCSADFSRNYSESFT